MFSRFHDCTISGLPYCASDSPTRTNERRSKQKLTERSYITYMEIAMFTLQALKSQSLLRGISSERIKHLCHLLDRAAVDLDQQQHGLCQASSLTDRFLPVQSPALSFVRKCAWDQKARVTFQINMFGSSRAGNEGDRRAPGLFELNENMADFHLYMHWKPTSRNQHTSRTLLFLLFFSRSIEPWHRERSVQLEMQYMYR